MLTSEKIVMVQAMSGEADGDTVSAYLDLAGSKICRLAYPFDPTVTEIPEQYEYLQIEIAVYLLNRRGTEGTVSHSENGYSDTYASADIPDELKRQIVPAAGVL